MVSETRQEKFEDTDAYRKISQMTARVRIVMGGTGAGKSFSILQYIVRQMLQALQRGGTMECGVFAYTSTKLKSDTLRVFQKVLHRVRNENIYYYKNHLYDGYVKKNKKRGVSDETLKKEFEMQYNAERGEIEKKYEFLSLNGNTWNSTKKEYKMGEGLMISFSPLETLGEHSGAKFDMCYINEVNNVPTIEGKLSNIFLRSNTIYMDFNPTARFWILDEYKQNETKYLKGTDKLAWEWLKLTYKDNQYVGDQIVMLNEIVDNKDRSPRHLNDYKVHILGEFGEQEGAIFKEFENYNKVKVNYEEAELLCYGLDHGYNDPVAITGLYRYSNQMLFRQRTLKSGLNLNDLMRELDKLGVKKNENGKIVFADNNNKMANESLISAGYNIMPVEKLRIYESIMLLQSEKFLVDEDSVDLLDELNAYVWEKNSKGFPTNKPMQNNRDHLIDTCRYSYENYIKMTKYANALQSIM